MEGKEKSAVVFARVSPRIKHGLEAAAKRAGHSVSREVERLAGEAQRAFRERIGVKRDRMKLELLERAVAKALAHSDDPAAALQELRGALDALRGRAAGRAPEETSGSEALDVKRAVSLDEGLGQGKPLNRKQLRRQINLRQLVAPRGRKAWLARQLDKSPSMITHMLKNPDSPNFRPITDALTLKIEALFPDREPGWFSRSQAELLRSQAKRVEKGEPEFAELLKAVSSLEVVGEELEAASFEQEERARRVREIRRIPRARVRR